MDISIIRIGADGCGLDIYQRQISTADYNKFCKLIGEYILFFGGEVVLEESFDGNRAFELYTTSHSEILFHHCWEEINQITDPKLIEFIYEISQIFIKQKDTILDFLPHFYSKVEV